MGRGSKMTIKVGDRIVSPNGVEYEVLLIDESYADVRSMNDPPMMTCKGSVVIDEVVRDGSRWVVNP
jgi:hypothetical protein